MTLGKSLVAAAVSVACWASLAPTSQAAIVFTSGALNKDVDAGFDTFGFSNPPLYLTGNTAVFYDGTLGFPDIPIQGNFPVIGAIDAQGNANPDWRPFRANGFTQVALLGGPADAISLDIGNADTDDHTATAFLHLRVLGVGDTVLGTFVSPGLLFSGTLFGFTNPGYSSFTVTDTTGAASITGYEFNVTTSSENTLDQSARDFSVVDNLRLDRTALFTGPDTGAVPEPTSWAMMILGFGGVGAVLRRRSARVAHGF